MGMVLVPASASGVRVVTLADCTLSGYKNSVINLPAGVTWGDIDKLSIGCACQAQWGQVLDKGSNGRVRYLDNTGSWYNTYLPADTDTSIKAETGYFVMVCSMIATLKS